MMCFPLGGKLDYEEPGIIMILLIQLITNNNNNNKLKVKVWPRYHILYKYTRQTQQPPQQL
jgi:hypothetical protein